MGERAKEWMGGLMVRRGRGWIDRRGWIDVYTERMYKEVTGQMRSRTVSWLSRM